MVHPRELSSPTCINIDHLSNTIVGQLSQHVGLYLRKGDNLNFCNAVFTLIAQPLVGTLF